jgi:formamidopyrimidine-DNA glycosylase
VPELPEAETIVRGLRSTIVGEQIVRTEVVRADILRESKRSFAARARGRTVQGVDRRAKNVVIRLGGDHVIAVNLGMTGRLLPFPTPPRGDTKPKHPAVRFRFRSGGVLIFDDTRRFGTVECVSAADWGERSSRMGPEPLEESYTAEMLHAGLSSSRSPVRSWLLDQRRIAGIGNIYAAEALFIAEIHPQRPARDIRMSEALALHSSIRKVLHDAIGHGGTTIRDYRNAEGLEGHYARKLHVYGREGEACPRCDARIEKVVFSNRSAFYCPTCQPVHGQ